MYHVHVFIESSSPFQVVHLIHGWMARKLQTHFSRATECLNLSTWLISCKLNFKTVQLMIL